MKTTLYCIEENSNSWHFYILEGHFHYVEDNEITDYWAIVEEYDVPKGQLEPEIIKRGLEPLIDEEAMRMYLQMFPKP